MGDVLLFTPKADLSAEKNLQGFEQFCRSELTLFGKDLPFDEHTWDLTNAITAKGKTKTLRAIFSSQTAARANKSLPAMSANFIGFAKSYFRYSLSLRSSTAWANRLSALRVLDDALCEGGFDGSIHNATYDVFVRAAQRIVEDYQPGTAHKIGGELGHIAKFLVEHELCQMNAVWTSPIKKPNDANIRVGMAAEKAREEKLPSKEAIEAIAYIFQHPADAADVFVSSALALLHCFPQRINEVARLPYDCEVEYDSAKSPQYGLREPGSKGFNDSVRWVLATMEGVARSAIRKIKDASREARNIALWYEENPDKIFIPREFEYLRVREFLTKEEVCLLLYGEADELKGKNWCQREGIRTAIPKHYRFTEVEQAVLGKLPKGFEFFHTRLSSGHKIVLLTITRLVELVDERTLVLMDEPEGHLHPPLLSAFVRSLSDLLVRRNGVAILATHSPVVLQEVPQSCAWILQRRGHSSIAERPTIETFGENLGVLTREVFGFEVTSAGFYGLIQKVVHDAFPPSYEQVLGHFDGKLGAEGRAISRALVTNRDMKRNP